MHLHDVLRTWVDGLTKVDSEQERDNRLVDLLDSLLSLPAADKINTASYQKRLVAARITGYGESDLTNTVIDLTDQILRAP